ncbi:short chain dehydrogenase/oxidoreductase CpoX2 [Lepidopterella palustris CBS 459.81]|uniref:Short chain dehydrogenase/oxidoreductase CpoX2 n=1 Tax=Lepidopterella palustris CBS 459.81 TaxID=1314670 RepID=A0A8E2E0Z0_9PEZI|nr:short chain dehydrogenase/oxidoreductase CpoX2 [Lepidopterella palustris CBS 459.81]
MASLANKVYAITGGASGMGLATARRLAHAKAAAICIGDYNTTNFDAVRKELESLSPDLKVHLTKLNVASSAEVEAWIADIVAKFGGLDGAVNAAGVAQPVGARKSPTILEETNAEWDRVMGINLAGVFYCNRAQVKAMAALPRSPRSIVNIASLASLMHGGDCYSYGISKAGVAYLTTGLSKDVGAFGIRVNTVSPSATNTPMLSQFFAAPPAGSKPPDTQGFHLIEADDIAQAITWLLSDDSSQVSGVNLPVGASAP